MSGAAGEWALRKENEENGLGRILVPPLSRGTRFLV